MRSLECTVQEKTEIPLRGRGSKHILKSDRKRLPRDRRNYAEFATAQKATESSESRPERKQEPVLQGHRGQSKISLQTFLLSAAFSQF